MNKKSLLILILILFYPIIIFSQSKDSSNANKIQNKIPVYSPFVLDAGLTMKSGSEIIPTLQQKIAFGEDKLIGTQWFSEKSILGKAGGISGRFVKYALLDVSIDYFSVVLSHEYYGHGARYRELNISDIFYKFKLPPPYGKGGGEASKSITQPISIHELISIWEGGVEVHPLINRNIALKWMSKDEVNYREASQYFWSFQIMQSYIQGTEENLNDGKSDNDLRAYTRLINQNAGITDINYYKMSVKDLKSKMMVNVVNPFIFHSLYTFLKAYLYEGKTSDKLIALNLGEVKYMPALRAGLTPFGIEYHFENYICYKNTASLLDISYGDQTFHSSWGGVGVQIKNIFQPKDFSFDINFNLWKQPELKFGQNPTTTKGGGLGGAFSVRGYYNIPDIDFPLSAVFELGYKSVGFLDGYKLDASPIIMFGLALRE